MGTGLNAAPHGSRAEIEYRLVLVVRPTQKRRVLNRSHSAAGERHNVMIFQALFARTASAVRRYEGALGVVALGDSTAHGTPDVPRIGFGPHTRAVVRGWQRRRSRGFGLDWPRGQLRHRVLRIGRGARLGSWGFAFAEFLPLESIAQFTKRQVEDGRDIAVGLLVPQQLLGPHELVARGRAQSDLQTVAVLGKRQEKRSLARTAGGWAVGVGSRVATGMQPEAVAVAEDAGW